MKIRGGLKDLEKADEICKHQLEGTSILTTRYAGIPWQDRARREGYNIPQNMGLVQFKCFGGKDTPEARELKKQIGGEYEVPIEIWKKIDEAPRGQKHVVLEELMKGL